MTAGRSRARRRGTTRLAAAAVLAVVALVGSSSALGAPTPPDPSSPPATTSPPPATTSPPAAGPTSTDIASTSTSTTTTTTTTGGATTTTTSDVTTTTADGGGAPTATTDATMTSTAAPRTAADAAPERVLVALLLAGTIGLEKEASVDEVSPGDSFTYTLVPSCSGLTEGCVNAVVTDVIPPEVDVTSLPPSTSSYTVAFDEATRTFTLTFIIPLASPPDPPGSVGMPAGSSFNVEIGVSVPPESQVVDGSVIVNQATMTADENPDVTAEAPVDVVVPRVVTPVATKTWSDGSAVAGSGEPSTIRLGIRNASSSTAEVTDLVVEDATPDVFERFDVTGIGPVTFPAGADQVVVLACTEVLSACDDADYVASAPQPGPALVFPPAVAAGDVTGLRFVFTNGDGDVLPYDPTGGTVDIELALRDTLRSTGDLYEPAARDDVENCALPSAVDEVAGSVTGDDACVIYAVQPAQATIAVAKSFFSDTNGDFTPDGQAVVTLNSPASALTSVTNTSPFPVSSITITEPSATSASEYAKLDVTDIRLVFPTGATTATLTVDCGGGVVLTDDFTAPPPTVNAPTGCAGPTAESVTVTYSGVDAAGNATITEGAIARLGVRGTLNDDVDDADVDDGVVDCADGAATSSIDGVGAAAGTGCATLDIQPAFSDVGGVKSAQLPTVLPGFPRLFDLAFTNSGTIPATDVVLADPVDPEATDNPFDNVRLANLLLPASPPAVAEVWDPDVSGYVPYEADDAALLERARGFRVTVASLPAGARYPLQFNVILRDGVPTGTTFQNCAGVRSATQDFSSFCSQALTVIEQSSGAALQKSIEPAQAVRPQPGLPGQVVQLKLAMQNTGTLFLRQLVGVDADPAFYDAVDLTGTVRVNFPPGSDRVRVDVCTGACGAADWTLGTVTGSQTPGLPGSVALGDVRGVRVVFTAFPVVTPTDPADEYRIRPGTNFPTTGPCTGASVCISFTPRAELRSAPGTPVPDTLVNIASGGFESRQQPPNTLAPIPPSEATLQLTSGTGQLQFSKSPNRTASPGGDIPFVLRAGNTGTGPIPDLTIVEPIPDGLDFRPLDPAVPYTIGYVLPAGAPEPPEVVFTQTVDPMNGRVTALRWDFPGWDLVPGAFVGIEVRTELAPGVTAGQVVENRAGASGDRPDLTCNTAGIPNPGQAVDDARFGAGLYCTSAAEVTVTAGNAFRAEKWVAGNPELGFLNSLTGEVVALDDPGCPVLTVGGTAFTRYPCVARVRPGQGFDFYLRLINTGTNPAIELRLVDVFPAPGDTGVILTGSARGTEWEQSPVLLSPVTLAGPGDLTVDYTAAPAPVCTTDLNRPPVACPAGSWPLGGYDPSATAFRAIVAFPDQLPPGGTTALRFRMAAPPSPADATNAIAWNSFAHTEFFQQGEQVVQLPATEPIKTGVAVLFGGLVITKTVDDPAGQADAPTFEILYECVVSPERGAPVIVAEGSVTLAGGEQANIDTVPAGADCVVWEPDANGLISNAPSREAGIVVRIPDDSTTDIATAAIVNTGEVATTTTVAPTTTLDPSSSVVSTTSLAPTTTSSAAAGAGGTLPATGSSTWSLNVVAAFMVALGAATLAIARRTRESNRGT